MMTLIQLIVMVVGLIMYMITTNPKLTKIGEIMFWTGLLSFLISGYVPHLAR